MKPESELFERLERYAVEAERRTQMLAAHFPDEVKRWMLEAKDLRRIAEALESGELLWA